MRYLCFVYCLVVSTDLFSQADQKIGSWKSYLPYRSGRSITQSDSAIFYGTEWSIMRVDKSDLTLSYFSKVEGLSDIGVKSVKYGHEEEVLIVIYDNSNIDLIFADEIVNLNQIVSNTQIVEDRTIHDVHIQSPHAYLATGFGLVQLNLRSKEFGFTTFTNTAVRSVVTLNDSYLYISTDRGIFRVSQEDQNNLADFSIWKPVGFIDGLPITHRGTTLEIVQDILYAGLNDELYRFNGQRFEQVHQEMGFDFQFAVATSQGLLTGWHCRTGCNAKKVLIDGTGQKRIINDCSTRTNDAIVDDLGRIWYADESDGFKYLQDLNKECLTIQPDRPPSINAAQMASFDRKLYVASGGVTINYGYLFREEGFYTNENGTWSTINRHSVSELNQRDMRDFVCIDIDKQGTVYVGTFWDGLIQYKDGIVTVFDKSNSSLQNSVINPDRNRITDLAFDAQDNLWLLNHDAPKPVSVFTKDGEWMNFNVPTRTNPEHIAIDQLGYKWISIGGVGLLVFDSGRDPLSTSDDRYRLINSTNSKLPNNSINALAADKDGGIWVGTTEGLVFFNCGSFAFEDNCTGVQLIVDQNGIPGALLGEENIKTIAIDGANQKWFGTTNGVFVQSADAESQVYSFNSRNSPLFDNGIIDIAIDDLDGEVFIATNRGILSYRGEATKGSLFHNKNALSVFPNPVRPGYNGPIAIKGLAENSHVKITDTGGNLIFETRAKGGQAVWDGNDVSGRRAATGVYLVYSAANQNLVNPDAAVIKLVLIN